MSTEDFKHESLQDVQSIGKYLREVTEGLESGELSLENDEGELVLRPGGLLGLELRAKRRGAYAKLQLKLSWKEESARGGLGALKISAGEKSEESE